MDVMPLAKATLLPLLFSTFCDWPIIWEASNARLACFPYSFPAGARRHRMTALRY
jgi:hypothetical protein